MTEPAQAQQPSTVLGAVTPRTPPARLGVAVVHDLVEAIVTGEVQPGAVLPPEGVLSQTFGVSRTVIRESVKRVEEKGLLTVAQGRGTSVNEASAWNVLDPVVLSALVEHDDSLGILDELAVVRGVLEGSMASAAAGRRTTERTEALQHALDHMAETIDDFEAYSQADVDFHFTVMDQSGTRLAPTITRILFDRARESSRFTGAPREEALRLTLDEHQAVLDAIEAGDAEGAQRAMQHHIAEAWARRRLPTARDA
ncbi:MULTISPECIES: FadR/GntR family transcriptional regulator [unclassified Agrococcus]|uniref:FadR/GntR family transcriptional regulator n=1 Tax=unclassified Agrococcus TaxID=2615065 RepID=UPI003617F556